MGLFVRRNRAETGSRDSEARLSPTVRALEFLDASIRVRPDADALVIEERAVWQPDSWLLQRCWHELAEHGAARAALEVADLLEARNPLARVQALYQVARHIQAPDATARGIDPEAEGVQEARQQIAQEIRRLSVPLFKPDAADTVFKFTDQLLYIGAAAAQLGNIPLACACLERLDQLAHPWDRVFIPLESRSVLAETVVRIGLHPLTDHLLAMAIRRYEEPGAQFLHQVMRLAAARLQEPPRLRTAHIQRRIHRRTGRLIQRCVDVFQFSTLSTLTTRRLAATAFGQIGAVREVLEQIETIANVQAARQETGLGGSRSDPHFLRQVKRPTANLDIDFQIYTLQEAIKVMPLRKIERSRRVELARRVAELATRSDGWTAAGAVATLVELGAFRFAVNVMDFIPDTDTTRSEGVISLVRALLAFDQFELAHEQVEKAIAWAQSLPGRNAERALIWGLAEVFMEHNMPERAIQLLDLRITPPGFGERVRRLFGNAPSDDELRDNRLRFQALILQETQAHTPAEPATQDHAEPEQAESPVMPPSQSNPPGTAWSREQDALYRQLRQWTPRLLEGESLITFYVEGLIRPLFMARQIELIVQLLPQICATLQQSTGDKHTVHIRKIAGLLAQAIAPGSAASARSLPRFSGPEIAQMRGAFADFLTDLWAVDAQRGVWQMVHSLEGSLPLLLALEGPQALVDIAHHTAETGAGWTD